MQNPKGHLGPPGWWKHPLERAGKGLQLTLDALACQRAGRHGSRARNDSFEVKIDEHN
jgi:hypothetical protein